MKWVMAVGILIIAGFLAIRELKKRTGRKGSSLEGVFQHKKSPYEQFLNEHATDWNIRHQRKEVVRHKQSLQSAIKSGDQVAAKIHRSMIVFGQSVINHFYEKLKP